MGIPKEFIHKGKHEGKLKWSLKSNTDKKGFKKPTA